MGTPDETRPDLVPLIDLDSDQADAVCDAMGNVGLEVVPHRLDTGARDGDIAKALIRLYVPRSQIRDARDVVRGVLPEYGPSAGAQPPKTLRDEEESAWADIVAELRAEGLDDHRLPPAPAAPIPDHDERFVPPTPPPLPRISRTAWLSWVGVVLGIVVAMVGSSGFGGTPVTLLGIGMFIGGFVGLISRARASRDDDYDDGAVV